MQCLCCLETWHLNALREGQNLEQNWQVYPEDITCFDSTCWKRTGLNLVKYPQSLHCHIIPPSADVFFSILAAISPTVFQLLLLLLFIWVSIWSANYTCYDFYFCNTPNPPTLGVFETWVSVLFFLKISFCVQIRLNKDYMQLLWLANCYHKLHWRK